jgi:hypothetical protein
MGDAPQIYFVSSDFVEDDGYGAAESSLTVTGGDNPDLLSCVQTVN